MGRRSVPGMSVRRFAVTYRHSKGSHMGIRRACRSTLFLILAGVLAVAGVAGCSTDETNRSTAFNTAARVQEAMGQEAEDGHPVRLRSVVTYVDTTWGYLFLQDETGGLFIRTDRDQFERMGEKLLTPDRRIELQGVAGSADGAVDSVRVWTLGRRAVNSRDVSSIARTC